MLRNITKIAACGLTLMFLHACDNKLDIVNPNRLSADQFYQNQDQAIAAVDAIYNVLIIDGLYQRMTPVFNDGRSDELSCRSPWVFLTGLSNFTVPATDGANEIAWAGYYIMVSRTNQAIENIPNVPEVDENLRGRLMGQAYFLRALAYFNIANIFGTAPLILEVPKEEEAFYPSNEGVTKDMIYNQVQTDLENAVQMLPLDYNTVDGPDREQVGRATRGAALSLLGKLHLYKGNYTAAAGLFKQVIDLGIYEMSTNYMDLFTGDPAKEQAYKGKIFWAEFTTSANVDYNWGGDPTVNWRQFIAVTPTYSRNDFFDFYPTRFLYDEMREEKTVDDHFDPRYHAAILSYVPEDGYTTAYGVDWAAKGYGPNDYFIKKYTNAITGSDPFTSGINYYVIRYEDVLLMYAECLANNGDIPGAAEYVQMVRSRVNLPDRETEFAAYSLPQFMDQLAHERIMELAIEGSRWYDLQRWGWLDDPSKLTELKAHDFEFNTYVPERNVMPIPQTDLDRNPNLSGNSANQ